MKLHESFLCIDCEEVFRPEKLHSRCPCCGSSATAPVGRWIMTYENYDRTIGPFLTAPEIREEAVL